MKRLPINDQERQFIKSIQTTAVVYLLMFRIYPHPLNSDALAFEMKWDKRKSKKMLDDLSSDGFTALVKGQGYVLTSQARGMVIEFLGDQIALPIEAQALAQGGQAQAHEALEGKVIVSENSTHGARALGVGESLTTGLKTDSPTPLEDAHFVQWPTAEKIIAATPILFGEPGVVRGQLPLDEISPRYLLSVIAHCYDLRQTREQPKGLYKPAGMAYSMLTQDKQPREVYIKSPMDYLPDDYLAVLGLVDHTCGSCGEKFSKLESLKAHEAAMHVEAEPAADLASIVETEEPAVTIEIDTKAQAQDLWEQVQAQLQMEMPRASFSNWVRPAKAVKYDGRVLTVMAHDQYDREWLESRLESVVNRLLIGILNAEATVEFVIAQQGGE